MVNVGHIIPGSQVVQFLQGHRFLPGITIAKAITVIPIEDLVVGETGDLQVVVGKTLVYRITESSVTDWRLSGMPRLDVFQDRLEALALLRIIGEQDVPESFFRIFPETVK
jgi:hypothetical protein